MTAQTQQTRDVPLPELYELENVTAMHPGVVVIRVKQEGEPKTATVVAEPSPTPGLVINPASDADRGFTGWWSVTHALSGLAIPSQFIVGETLPAARRIAEALGKTGVDWTLPYKEIRGQITANFDAVKAAIREGRYLAPEPDDEHTPKGEGPAPRPRSEAQATADALARYLVSVAQERCALTWKLIKRTDQDGLAIYAHNTGALCAEFGVVSVLREFARVDQVAADAAARAVWSSWDAGESVHELIGEWADEYGIPQPPTTDEDNAAAPAGDVDAPEAPSNT